MRFFSVRAKMLAAFALVSTICSIGISLLALAVFWQRFESVTGAHLQDAARQTTNNLSLRIEEIENRNIQLLSSTVIQEALKQANEEELTLYQQRNLREKVLQEMERITLFGGASLSFSIFSDSGLEYTVNRITGKTVEQAFTKEELYEAKGSTLWRLTDREHHVCAAKAILDLATMQPLGYINIVYRNTYFGDLAENGPSGYSCTPYLADADHIVIYSSDPEEIGTPFFAQMDEDGSRSKIRREKDKSGRVYLYEGERMQNGWVLVETIQAREFYRNIRQIILVIILITLLFLLLGLFAVRKATAKILRPTQDLLHSMQLFGSGNLACRVQMSSNDEVGQIGREYNAMADNIQQLIRQVYEMEIVQKQSEIDFLRMQINPHFLYNTLDTIGWLNFANETEEVSEVVVALAELLRAMVKKDRYIPIEEELQSVKDYLLIQKHRFGDRISVVYEIDPSILHHMIPNFILQPLIENAIIHGLEPKIENGTVLLRITKEGEMVHFAIQDDGIGMSQTEIRQLLNDCNTTNMKKSVGLRNVYRRLLLCYGECSRMQIESREQEGTTITFLIPAAPEADERNKGDTEDV